MCYVPFHVFSTKYWNNRELYWCCLLVTVCDSFSQDGLHFVQRIWCDLHDNNGYSVSLEDISSECKSLFIALLLCNHNFSGHFRAAPTLTLDSMWFPYPKRIYRHIALSLFIV